MGELRALTRRMAMAEVSVGDILSPGQLERLLASSFDPFAAPRVPNAGVNACADDNPYPASTDTYWSRYRAGDAWHATFWVGEWPRDAVPGDFLAPLILESEGTRVITTVAQPVPVTAPGAEVLLDSPDGKEYAAISLLADRAVAGVQTSHTPLSHSAAIATALRDRRPVLWVVLGNGTHS